MTILALPDYQTMHLTLRLHILIVSTLVLPGSWQSLSTEFVVSSAQLPWPFPPQDISIPQKSHTKVTSQPSLTLNSTKDPHLRSPEEQALLPGQSCPCTMLIIAPLWCDEKLHYSHHQIVFLP